MSLSPRTRCWSIATSPRSPYKLPAVIELLDGFMDRPWDKTAQKEYARQMFASEDYEGEGGSGSESDFAARDRVNRAPRTLGFIQLARSEPPIILPSGKALVAGGAQDDLFLRQLLKWQYPSPLHDGRDYQDLFYVHPFLEVLRLIRDLGQLSKVEMSLFAVPLIDLEEYESTRRRIRVFRRTFSALHGTMARRRMERDVAIREVERIWADDIAEGRIQKREAAKGKDPYAEFLRARISLLRDYGDNAMRYFRATGLFTLAGRGGLSILEERREEVDAILSTFDREPLEFDNIDDYYAWMGDPKLPVLPSDETGVLRRQLLSIFDALPESDRTLHASLRKRAEAAASIHHLKSLYQELTDLAAGIAVREAQRRLAGQDAINDILYVYEGITERDPEIVDRPLTLEWNTWRALTMMDDAIHVNANFQMDREGQPLNPAPGRVPDIDCEYRGFLLAVEVTLTTGVRQFAAEGEPVERHVGYLQRDRRALNDMRDVYGLFIAPVIAASVNSHFWNLHNARRPTIEFAGFVRVVPLTLEQFTQLIERTRRRLPVDSEAVRQFFATASQAALDTDDEVAWRDRVRELIATWSPAFASQV